MQVVLLRVGIDTGSGGIHGPLYKDGTFEFVPISDKRNRFGVNLETYGNTRGAIHGKLLIDYFPDGRRDKTKDICIHDDPEFQTFTYGDPTTPKAGLRKLKRAICSFSMPGCKAGTTTVIQHSTSLHTSK